MKRVSKSLSMLVLFEMSEGRAEVRLEGSLSHENHNYSYMMFHFRPIFFFNKLHLSSSDCVWVVFSSKLNLNVSNEYGNDVVMDRRKRCCECAVRCWLSCGSVSLQATSLLTWSCCRTIHPQTSATFSTLPTSCESSDHSGSYKYFTTFSDFLQNCWVVN